MADSPKASVGLNVEVHFSRRSDELWIRSQSSAAPPEDLEFGYLHLFANFAIRQMVNMVPQEQGIASVLAETLARMPGKLDDLEGTSEFYGTRFVNKPGQVGKRSFGCVLQLEEGEYGPVGFQVHPKGFGLRAKGIEGNAMVAVVALASWLAQVREPWSEGPQYGERLTKIGGYCGSDFLTGVVKLQNQHYVASSVVHRVWTET
jgi:hypothetical protein